MIEEVRVNISSHRHAVQQIKRDIAPLVLEISDATDFAIRATCLVKLARFAVNEDCIRPFTMNDLHHEHTRFCEVTGCSYESIIAAQLLVPNTVERTHPRGHIHLVDGRVELHP